MICIKQFLRLYALKNMFGAQEKINEILLEKFENFY
jgi:hypothetical protein